MSENIRFKKNLIETNDQQAEILYQLRLGSAKTDTTILSSVVSSIILGAKHQDGEFGFEFDVYDSQGTNDAYLNYLTRYNSTQTVRSLNIITIKDTETPTPQIILNANELRFDTFSTGAAFGGGGITSLEYLSSQSISTNALSSINSYFGNADILNISTNRISLNSLTTETITDIQDADFTSISTTNVSSGSGRFGSAKISTIQTFTPLTVTDAVLFNSTIYARSTIETNEIKIDQISSAIANFHTANITSSLTFSTINITYDQSNLNITGIKNLNVSGSALTRYIGAFTSDPIGTFYDGDIYYNTTTSTSRLYVNSLWTAPNGGLADPANFLTLSSGTINGGVFTTNTISTLTISSGTAYIGNANISNISTIGISSGAGYVIDLTVSSFTAATSSITIATTQRINQELSYSTVTGYYSLDKNKRPLPNPYSAGSKAVQTWTARTSPNAVTFTAITYSPTLVRFVAVASSGTASQRIAVSSDGINWSAATAPSANNWNDVCWSPDLNLFVACAGSGGTDRIMTSSDGLTWSSTGITTPSNNWNAICWSSELRLFVAVASSGTGNRVMTSPDAINWTSRTSAQDNNWNGICWSPELRLFVAVSSNGTTRIMTSPNGINWTLRTNPNNEYARVCWSPELGLFLAVSTFFTRATTSPDGITWTNQTTQSWSFFGCAWVPELGLFVKGGAANSVSRVLTSPDGVVWTARSAAVTSAIWRGFAYSPELGILVACSTDATASTDKFQTFTLTGRPPAPYNIFNNLYNRIDESGTWYFSNISSANMTVSTQSSDFLSIGNQSLTLDPLSLVGFSTTVLSSGTSILGITTAGLVTTPSISSMTLSSGTAILGTTTTQLLNSAEISTVSLSSGTAIVGNANIQLVTSGNGLSTITVSSGTTRLAQTIATTLSTLTISSGTTILGNTTAQLVTAAGLSTTTLSSGTAILGGTTSGLVTAAGVSTTTLSSGVAILGNTTAGVATAPGVSTLSVSSGTSIFGQTVAVNVSTLTISSGTGILGNTTAQLVTAAGISTTTLSTGTSILGGTTTGLLRATGVSTTSISSGVTILGNTTAGVVTAPGVSTLSVSSGTSIFGASLIRADLSTLTISSGTTILGSTRAASISTLSISTGTITNPTNLTVSAVSTTTVSSGTTILGNTTTTQLVRALGVSTTTVSSGTAILGDTVTRGGLSTISVSSGTSILGATTLQSISTIAISTGSLTTGSFPPITTLSTLLLSTGTASIGFANVSTLAGFSPINVRDALIINSTVIASSIVTNVVNVSSIGGTSQTVVYSAFVTGADNQVDPAALYSGTTRVDTSGNTYTLTSPPGRDGITFQQPDRINVCNGDGSVFASFAVTGYTTLIVKRNSSGVVQWYVTAVTPTLAIPCGIEVDSNGNVYSAGYLYGNTTFNGTDATTIAFTRAGGSYSAYFAKWNSAGVIQFAFNPIAPTTNGNSIITNLRIYNDELYLVGGADTNLSYNIRSSNNTTFRSISVGTTNGLFIKYNASGIASAAFMPFNGLSRGLNIDIDSSGNVYIGALLASNSTTYTIRNYVGGTESASSLTFLTSTGNDAIFVKYNSSFTAQWLVGLRGTGTQDLLTGFLISGSTIFTSMNVSSTSLEIIRNNGTTTTLATLTLVASGSVFLSFDFNGGLNWNVRLEPSGTGTVFLEGYTVNTNGDIYISGTTRATAVILRSAANVTTTVTRTGYLADAYIFCLTSAGEYKGHWYVKNANCFYEYSNTTFTTDLMLQSANKVLLHLNDGYAMGFPSLKSLLNNTLVVAFKITTNTRFARIIDFCLGNSINSYILFSGSGATLGNFSFHGRWQLAAETVLNSGVASQINTQYVLTMYIQATTCTFFIYTWNGSAVTQVYTGTMTYSNGGGSTAPLNQLRTLWFGRSSYSGDAFYAGSYQKILLWSGQITTPSTTLPLIFTSANANSASGTKYTFGAATGYTPMNVYMYNSPSNTTSEITLTAASKQYLALTDLTILEEDTTRIYDTTNNVLGTISTIDRSLITGMQTALVSLNLTPSVPQIAIDNYITNEGNDGRLKFGTLSAPVKYYNLTTDTNIAYNTTFQDPTAVSGTVFPTSSFSTSFTAFAATFDSSNGPINLGNYANVVYTSKNFNSITQVRKYPSVFDSGYIMSFNGYKLETVGDSWAATGRSTLLYDPSSNILFQSSGYYLSPTWTIGLYRTSNFFALYTFDTSTISMFYSTTTTPAYTNFSNSIQFTPYYVIPFIILYSVDEYTTTTRNFMSTLNQISLVNTSTLRTNFAQLSTISIISTVNINGRAMIGATTPPSTLLELNNTSNGSVPSGNANAWNDSLGFSGTSRAWTLGIETTNGSCNALGFFNYSNSTISGTRYIRGYLLGGNSGSNKQMNFTGQHRCVIQNESLSTLQSKIGFIVCSDKNTYIDMYSGSTIRGKGAITIDEALPVVTIAANENDKTSFGVLSFTEDPYSRTSEAGAFVTPYSKELGDTRVFVNGLGEGAIWVTNKNGNLEAGDYITSSRIPGYGQKQHDDKLHNYTVAKVTMDCDFTAPLQSTYEILTSSYEFSTFYTSSQIAYFSSYFSTPVYSSIIFSTIVTSTIQSSFQSTFISSMNVLDANGNIIWIPVVDVNGIPIMETAYTTRYVNEEGIMLSKEEYDSYISSFSTAYIAAFVGCTYHSA
jgi:hypothetical protein